MHTFKGMAAAMGFNQLTELAHRTETLLDVVRSDPGSASLELLDLLFRIVDALEAGVPEAVSGGDAKLDFTPLLEELTNASAASAPTGSWALPVRADRPAPVAAGRLVRNVIAPVRQCAALVRCWRSGRPRRWANQLHPAAGQHVRAGEFDVKLFRFEAGPVTPR
jgi:HPt (histidine-containing phosphotransfer) domain-containing protein